MGLTLKEEKHKVTLQVQGDGPIGQIVADANGRGEVRGYVDNPAVEGNQDYKLDVASAVGKGSIYVIKDLGLKEPYRGTSPIISGELAEDFTYYLTVSEQIPSSVGLGVLVQKEKILVSGGYMIQVLPGADDETISRLEQRISELKSITERLKEGETPEKLLAFLMGNDLEILHREPVQFACNCSRTKTEAMLKALGREELESILRELGQAEVICHFCNEKYLFSAGDLEKLISSFDR